MSGARSRVGYRTRLTFKSGRPRLTQWAAVKTVQLRAAQPTREQRSTATGAFDLETFEDKKNYRS
jgi:hypothetical protein